MGGPRDRRDHDSIHRCRGSSQQPIEYRFDPCTECAQHLITTNPWTSRTWGRPFARDQD